MSISYFLVIFWARRYLIIAATVSCLVGALIVTALLPPRWESTARVMLDYIKPDPVTGLVVAGNSTRAYELTQTELVTDYSVASRAAEQAGMLTDPALIDAWNSRPKSDQRDFRRWLADLVILHTKAKLVQDSNILEITYTGRTANDARRGADGLLKAYLDYTLQYKHSDAERNAVWYTAQTEKAKQALDEAVAAKTAFERANGVVMQDDKMDAEGARLATLNLQSGPLGAPMVPTTEGSSAAMQLAAVQAQLATAQKTLGPNNPEILDLESRRSALQTLVQREKAANQEAVARAASGGAQALAREVEAQKSKVIADSEKLGRLNQLQQDVNLRRDEYNHAAAKASEYRQEANSTDIPITPLGTAATPKQPTFPNYMLIIPGAVILGLGVGILCSVLMELLGRRVRAPSDLYFGEDIPVICVVPAANATSTNRFQPFRLFSAGRPVSSGAVNA